MSLDVKGFLPVHAFPYFLVFLNDSLRNDCINTEDVASDGFCGSVDVCILEENVPTICTQKASFQLLCLISFDRVDLRFPGVGSSCDPNCHGEV